MASKPAKPKKPKLTPVDTEFNSALSFQKTLNKDNLNSYNKTKTLTHAANKKLREQIARQNAAIRAAASAELGRLGHSENVDDYTDLTGNQQFGSMMNEEANFDSIQALNQLKAIEKQRGKDLNDLNRRYKDEIKANPLEEGEEFTPFEGGGFAPFAPMSMGGFGGGFGGGGYYSDVMPERSAITQGLINEAHSNPLLKYLGVFGDGGGLPSLLSMWGGGRTKDQRDTSSFERSLNRAPGVGKAFEPFYSGNYKNTASSSNGYGTILDLYSKIKKSSGSSNNSDDDNDDNRMGYNKKKRTKKTRNSNRSDNDDNDDDDDDDNNSSGKRGGYTKKQRRKRTRNSNRNKKSGKKSYRRKDRRTKKKKKKYKGARPGPG